MFSKSMNCYEVCGSTISEGIKPKLTGNPEQRGRDLLSIAHGKTSLTPIHKSKQSDFSDLELQKIFSEGIREAEFEYRDNQFYLLDKDADSDSIYIHVKSLFIGEHLRKFDLTETSLKTGKLKILFSTQVKTSQNDWSLSTWPIVKSPTIPSSIALGKKEYLENQFAYFLEARPGAKFQTTEWTSYAVRVERIISNFVVTKSGQLQLVSSNGTIVGENF